MADEWYLARDGKQLGPYSVKAVRELALAGRLSPDDLVWTEWLTDWIEAREVAGLFPEVETASDSPAESQKTPKHRPAVEWRSADRPEALPIDCQQPRESEQIMSKRRMRLILFVSVPLLILFALCFLAVKSSFDKNDINRPPVINQRPTAVGKWKRTDNRSSIEFFDDGRFTSDAIAGDWKTLSDGRIRLETALLGTASISIGILDRNDLTLQTGNTQTTYKRWTAADDAEIEAIETISKANGTVLNDVVLLRDTHLSDKILSAIAAIRGIKRLAIRNEQITDEVLMAVHNARLIHTLDQAHWRQDYDQQFSSIAEVTAIDLSRSQITDAALPSLSEATALESLNLSLTSITGSTLDSLNVCKNLRLLDLSMSRVNDDGLKKLNGLHSLVQLILVELSVTDNGIKELKHFPSLENLAVAKTAVTVEGLAQLRECKTLKRLWLGRPDDEETGARFRPLRKHLPRVEIIPR